MNWKQVFFWSLLAIAIFYYFLLFGVFLFAGQEEMQLFIPRWWFIREQIFHPGGVCEVVGQWIIQYYRRPMMAVAIHTALLMGCGWMIHRVLSGFSGKSYWWFLAVSPVLYLAKKSVEGDYLVDGTVGVSLMLGALLLSSRLRSTRWLVGYGIVSICVLCWLTGSLSVYYALLYALLSLLRFPDRRWALVATGLIPALLIYLLSGWLGIPVPLREGWMPDEYLAIQRLPHYYMYQVWTFFALGLAGVFLGARFLPVLARKGIWADRLMGAACVTVFSVSALSCVPGSWHAQRMMLDELSFLARERQWDVIIDKYRGKQIHNYASLNYLNLSLARKGELADRMFAFDQKGTKSLRADWNQTFYMDRLLSDVHFLVGDVSLSESLAMDGFTQAKRKGSARMMQRLVQVSLIRGETGLARKYLGLLAAMPFYRDWAERHLSYLARPELMREDPELGGKRMPVEKSDRLALSVPADSLWNAYDLPDNRTGWEYRGCYYLLGKDLEAFGRFLDDTSFREGEALPRHFQEAGLLLADKDSMSFSPCPVEPEIADRYREFKQVVRRSANQVDVSSVYRRFGDTYWFYYYFKIFKGEEQ